MSDFQLEEDIHQFFEALRSSAKEETEEKERRVGSRFGCRAGGGWGWEGRGAHRKSPGPSRTWSPLQRDAGGGSETVGKREEAA